MIVQLLALGRLVAKERAAGEDQILALIVERLVHQEILLLRAYSGGDAGCVAAEELQHADSLLVQRLHGAQQRRLCIQRLAAIGAEGRGNAQHTILDKRIAGGVPGGIAARLEGGT